MPFEPIGYEPVGYEPDDLEPSLALAVAGDPLAYLTIGATEYGADDRAEAGIFNLQWSWDLEAPWSLTFSVARPCSPTYPFPPGLHCSLRTTNPDGSGSTLRFVGDLFVPHGNPNNLGIQWNYTATDLKARADRVTLAGLDGSGTARFNMAPDDYMSLAYESGKTVGEIVRAILEQSTNAAALDALGVGAYTSLSPPTLPDATLADLAALTVVPREPAQLSGESLLNTLEQFVLRWHAQFCLYVLPNGLIRCHSVFGMTPAPVVLPSGDGTGDNVDWPDSTGPDCSDCWTSWEIRGLDIQTAYLNTHDGTLSPAWASYQQSAWTLLDFLQPKDAADEGTASGVTSVSCTVKSDFARAHWGLNFWNGANVGGWVYLYYPAGTGVDLYEMRQITSCTALAAGGTATITWDSALPLNSTSYTRYRIVGLSSPPASVGREYHIREPATGKLDRETWVGSHLEPRNPKGAPVANNSRTFNVFYPYAFVQWSRTGNWPWFEEPVNVQINQLTGRVILTQPAVVKSAAFAGTTSLLYDHYPANYAEGLYYNLQVVVPYNRGGLGARWPATGETGKAHELFGIVRPKIEYQDSFTWAGDAPDLQQLARERLAVYQDPVTSGDLNWHTLPTAFDSMTPGYRLDISLAAGTTPYDGLDLPARAASFRWCDPGEAQAVTCSMRFSTMKRPFQGDSLYIHPALGQDTFGTADGGVFGSSFGSMDFQDFNQMGMDIAADRRASMPQNAIEKSLAPGSSDPLGDIAANHEALGSELFAQAHPGDAFAAQADEVNAGLDARNAPIAEAFQQQAQAAGNGDPFGVMQGYSPGRSPQPSQQSAAGRQQAETQGRVDAREAAREKAARTAQQARQPTPRSERVDTGEARAAEGRDAPVDPMHPQSIMNMAPDPDEAGFGAKINPDVPASPERRIQRPRGPGLARKRGEVPDDDTQMGGGG